MGKSLRKNTIYNTLKTCSSIIFPLITFPYITRVLLPENVGRVNFAVSFVSYYALVASLGVSTYAIRECAVVKKDNKALSDLSSQIFSINVITTGIAYLLLALTLLFVRKVDSYRLLIVIESTTILLTTIGADWLNSAMEDFKYIALRTMAFQFIALIATFVFVKTRDDYIKYAIISVVSAGGANVVNALYRRRFCHVGFTTGIDWKRHLTPILLLFVMNLAHVVFANADVIMLGLMRTDYEVGIYTTALKVNRVISQVVQSVILVLLPRLTSFFANHDYENANKLLRKLLSFNIALGLPCVVGVEMLADDIVYVVGGAEFVSAAPVLRILIICFMFSLVGGSFLGNGILIPTRREKYYMLVCCITAVANVIVNYILIPGYGANGAAFATALNGFLIFFLMLFRIDKNVHIERIGKVFIAPVAGCVLIAGCCFACSFIGVLWIRIIMSVLSSVCIYAATLIVLKYDLMMDTLAGIRSRLKRK